MSALNEGGPSALAFILARTVGELRRLVTELEGSAGEPTGLAGSR